MSPSDRERPAEARVVLEQTVFSLARAEHPSSDDHTLGTPESRERLAHTAERRVWVTEDASRASLARDVGARAGDYARALRDDGMTARAVLSTVEHAVRDAAGHTLGAQRLAALVHEAGRSCVAAYYAR